MPIYEYRCVECHRIFEDFSKHIEEETETNCPVCRNRAKRLISSTSFSLKGTGWYATDYGTLKGRASADSDAGKEQSTGTDSTASSASSSPGSSCSAGCAT